MPFVVWSIPTILILLDTLHTTRGEGASLHLRTLWIYAASFYLWAALTPLMLRFGRRIGVCRPNRGTAIVLHLVAIALLTVLQAVVSTGVRWLVLPRTGGSFGQVMLAENFLNEIRATARIGTAAIVYSGTLLVGYALLMTRRYRERDLEAARLGAQLAEARLSALRMQLNPHFLFNSLNAIAGLVREQDNRTAVRMLALLSDVLRHALSTSTVHELPLREELAFIEEYLEIERVRFPDRLQVHLRIPEAIRDALVPSLLLQPIVENALRHGIHRRSARGHLEIEAERRHDVLRLVVRDDGPGFRREPRDQGGGVGLANTRARLRQLYGDDARLVLSSGAVAGAEVVIELPYHLGTRVSAAATPPTMVASRG